MMASRAFKVDEDVLKHLFTLTNGHPGLTLGLLTCLFDRADVRPLILTSGVVTMVNAAKFFDDDDALFFSVEHRVGRSLPHWRDLQKPANKDLVELLRRAVQNHGVEAFEPEDIPGLEEAYKSGFLHATSTSYVQGEGQNLYAFPSLLHHRAVERLLFADADDGIQISLKEVVFQSIGEVLTYLASITCTEAQSCSRSYKT
ncbi:hypothetical protein VTN77DRAFT_941 [Rasamsonia byssochlamydoides]|uniref:uncharacterized protein n=1 Tax=Rasamsonia byssochlamydoides TaxID=89139 RepID=UPI00374418DF